jgi:hypothetical protein
MCWFVPKRIFFNKPLLQPGLSRSRINAATSLSGKIMVVIVSASLVNHYGEIHENQIPYKGIRGFGLNNKKTTESLQGEE